MRCWLIMAAVDLADPAVHPFQRLQVAEVTPSRLPKTGARRVTMRAGTNVPASSTHCPGANEYSLLGATSSTTPRHRPPMLLIIRSQNDDECGIPIRVTGLSNV